ncbi:MAG: quinone-dependent dihydroorotate dehydrogenase, partial [Flavobacteriaceae bacterium]
ALLAIGFGFSAAGTVSPRAHPGNPRPRVFRLREDRALINRLGFNNQGHEAALKRLLARPRRGVVGINIGANKDSGDRVADYVAGIETFAAVASYFTVNVSSPNTPGLRSLQEGEALDDLLAKVMTARDSAAGAGRKVPVLLKVAPDLDDMQIEAIAVAVRTHRVDGMIVSNTTLARPGLKSPLRDEAGGLSGYPLFERSTVVLARMRMAIGADLPIIGVGGIHSADSAWEKLRAGANLLQIYSALVYEGIELVSDIAEGLARRMREEGFNSVKEVTSSGAEEWAARAP